MNRDLWLEAVAEYRGQFFSPEIAIGDGTTFSDGVHVTCIEKITIGSHVVMGSRVYISDHNHGSYRGECQSAPMEEPAQRQLGGGGAVNIGDNVWIGDNVVIVGPADIGDGAILGANSVVRGTVPAETMVAGMPAKAIKKYNARTKTWNRV